MSSKLGQEGKADSQPGSQAIWSIKHVWMDDGWVLLGFVEFGIWFFPLQLRVCALVEIAIFLENFFGAAICRLLEIFPRTE